MFPIDFVVFFSSSIVFEAVLVLISTAAIKVASKSKLTSGFELSLNAIKPSTEVAKTP